MGKYVSGYQVSRWMGFMPFLQEEQWQMKIHSAIFRMYQLNFDGNDDFVYKKYWDMSNNHFIEKL